MRKIDDATIGQQPSFYIGAGAGMAFGVASAYAATHGLPDMPPSLPEFFALAAFGGGINTALAGIIELRSRQQRLGAGQAVRSAAFGACMGATVLLGINQADKGIEYIRSYAQAALTHEAR